MIDYPYMVSNNKIAPIISGIQSAAKPNKFTAEILKNLGFASSNDRAVINLFKRLGFLTADGAPTVYFDQLRDKVLYKRVLASQIKELYSELFTINTQIYKDTEENIKGAISRVTGSESKTVIRIYATFKALCNIADFGTSSNENNTPIEAEEISAKSLNGLNTKQMPDLGFHYNIQIHLPATTDISVYNAIFKSLKENLLV